MKFSLIKLATDQLIFVILTTPFTIETHRTVLIAEHHGNISFHRTL